MPTLPGVWCSRRAGAQLGHGSPVALDEPVKAPLALEDPVHQVVVAAARDAIDGVERAHGRVRAGVDRGLERRQVEVPQPLLGQVGRVVVTAALRLAVGREMLGAGHQLVRRAVVGPLDRLDPRSRQHRVQVRILAGGLSDPAPARLVRDVDHRRIGLLEPDHGRLARAVLVVVERHLRIEARTGAERDREDGTETVDGVEGEQDRDLQPRLLHGDALQLPDPHRIGHAQDRAEPLAHFRLGDQEVRQQLDLLQLLLKRHPRQQVAHPRLDGLVGRLPSGLERLLVARLRRGHHTTCGRQHQRQDRHGDRSPEPEPPHGSPPRWDRPYREAASGARKAAGLPCSDASSGKPWTEVDHPTNLDDGFVALRIHEARRSDQRSGRVPAHDAAPFGEATQSGYRQAGRTSSSDVTPSAVTPDKDHSGRGDQQPEDSLDRGHHAASAPTRHRTNMPPPARLGRFRLVRLANLSRG